MNAVVTGMGAISAAGTGARALAEAVAHGRPVAREITAWEPADDEPERAAEAADFDLGRFLPSVKSYLDRTSALALAAAKLALDEAGLSEKETRPCEVGLAYGTQWGCLDSMEVFFEKVKTTSPRFAPPLPFSHSYANSPASVLAIEFGLNGYHVVFSTGRTSGAWALLGAMDAISAGRTTALLAAASDALSRAAFRRYLAAGDLLPDSVEPLAGGERRFLLGEGGACLVVEEERSAKGRSAPVLAKLLAAEAVTASTPLEAAAGAARRALERAGLAARHVAAIVATAPGWQASGEAEFLRQSFGIDAVLVCPGAALGGTCSPSAIFGVECAVLAGRGTAVVVSSDGEAPGKAPSAIAFVVAPAAA